jgi:taurine dioxygenase
MAAGVEVRHLTPAIGAEIRGVDLSRALPDNEVEAIRASLNDRSVLLFREQNLTSRQHVEVSRRFGELELHVLTQYTLDEAPEVFVVSNIVENGRAIGIHDAAWHWHSDSSFHKRPSLGSLFLCRESPPEGGETEFASMFAAYDALDEATRSWLQGKVGIHDYADFYARTYSHLPPMTPEQKAKVPPVEHPMIRTHPETGRQALFFCEAQVREIVGVPKEEGRRRLIELEAHATRPEFVYTHKWRPGDLVFWDNRSSMHRARPFDDKTYRRLMHRTTIAGDAPFYRPPLWHQPPAAGN